MDISVVRNSEMGMALCVYQDNFQIMSLFSIAVTDEE